jgi:S-formylglutathione hydrolase
MNGIWTTLEIAGHQVDVYEPGSPAPARGAILHLHDQDGRTLNGQPAFTPWLDAFGLGCVCPHGDECWWSDRLTSRFDSALSPERYLLEMVAPMARQRWRLGARGLAIQGIGMGGQGALRLAFKYPETFPVAAGLASALDCHELHGQGTPLDELYDSREQCRQDTALLHVHPSRFPSHIFFAVDPDDALWFRGNDRLHEKLLALGIAHVADLTTRAGGHTWLYFNHFAETLERFIQTGLEQESRRLL